MCLPTSLGPSVCRRVVKIGVMSKKAELKLNWPTVQQDRYTASVLHTKQANRWHNIVTQAATKHTTPCLTSRTLPHSTTSHITHYRRTRNHKTWALVQLSRNCYTFLVTNFTNYSRKVYKFQSQYLHIGVTIRLNTRHRVAFLYMFVTIFTHFSYHTKYLHISLSYLNEY